MFKLQWLSYGYLQSNRAFLSIEVCSYPNSVDYCLRTLLGPSRWRTQSTEYPRARYECHCYADFLHSLGR